MADRTCETCRSYVAPGKLARNGQRYFTACCQHRQVANRHGILAVSLARAEAGPCGPAGRGWGAQ
jgi:hypothetical protein